ncbi:MAG: sigma-70 family RNA polymerase sigma factor [Chloroflexi bacterium]|jgi:RNA polymerase sigma-70 factor (ECF subfamily)|uniref:RNA polymerase subunit sigma-24 n=1 Tax=Candidatus Thermofonsia Clade 3 bacterium TaxID=2364212 RepID=A0A2M8QEZ1_9CHLR|nr:sigma-70 family RNA polymerase sigma factor [Candidatus Roseilinea sp. NK_OTU-006]PJF48376.1 MAG: RNA polymerase subunit sigma-24 [Candidatus Thermofonsia Clade 3 bacterium]RMG62525.1 MAG: sigma-70 family RNA polymerase sigma factor [Chloroflexota bacterium]
MDEAGLIRAAQRGDVAAFNQLVLAYQSQVYNVAYRILGEPAAASDAAQEAFLSAFTHINDYRGGSFKAWLLRIVTNACYDALRYAQRRPTASLEASDDGDEGRSLADVLPADDEDPLRAAERSDLRRFIGRAALQLPPDQRITFVLSDVQGLSYEEIAEVMQVSLGTVKSRLSRARAKLRDALLAHAELLPDEFRQ